MPVDLRFRVHVTNPKPRHGRVPKPRWGTWRLEALDVPANQSVPLLLARLERLLYLAPPAATSQPGSGTATLGRRRMRTWSLLGGSSAELVELRKGLLALSHLKGDFPDQGMKELDLRLESVNHTSRMVAPQQGQALLDTLRQLRTTTPLQALGPEVVK